jgi:CheY-like chemotaxis protein
MKNATDINRRFFEDVSFASLMKKRILNVLLVASKYDAFMLEDDGRIDEQIFNEYVSLSLRYPPRFTQVATEREAFAAMKQLHFDLVICMPNMNETGVFDIANRIKKHKPDIPIVVLTPFSREVTKRIAKEDLSSIDYVFSWLGNSELLLAIIKLIEDRMNVDADARSVGVQTILLVEDSIRFYSSALPHLYKFVLKQSKEFSKEALNAHQQTLRMRGRPKILLARNYEEAVKLYRKYSENMLGIICDMSFLRKGKKDKLAGYRFGKFIRRHDRHLPVIFDSSETDNIKYANKLEFSFIDKNSKTFPQDLHRAILNNFGFGDFILINPETGREEERITSLKDLQNKILKIPEKSLIYHLSRNHFSRFFYSRAIFPIARFLKNIDISEYENINDARQTILNAVIRYRQMKNSGVVAVFERERFDEFSQFARIGNDSLGGKGRGLAFLSRMIKMNWGEIAELFPDTQITIPKTLVLCTDIFDEFMETNNLYSIALQNISDEDILKCFIRANLPERLIEDVKTFFQVLKTPVAVRSSSLLEDSQYQPFAGIYKTYMVPHCTDRNEMIESIGNAIKGVYASVFYRDSKSYLTATQNLIDQEKMAVVLQEMAGTGYGDRYYPTFSGVARSLNYYPLGDEKTEEGIANVALGLGKYIVDGGLTLRFSPLHPHNVLQTASTEYALKETQTVFYALDLTSKPDINIAADDAYNLLKLPVKAAETDESLRFIASTYDARDDRLLEGYYKGAGRQVITFSGVLQNGVFPLAKILNYLLCLGQKEMGRPVEIEFAVNLTSDISTFYLLQIRPIMPMNAEALQTTVISPDKYIIKTCRALGHGVFNDIRDIIYVRKNITGKSSASNITRTVAEEIEQLNNILQRKEQPYILIGRGRWGSSDPSLGIPVRWSQISGSRLIVELCMENHHIEPSQGTHFFHNLTSFGVGYFTVTNDDFFDENRLNSIPAAFETKYVRHIHFDQPVTVVIDGRKGCGTVFM